MSKTLEDKLLDITTRELVRLSGKKAKDAKQYYTYINETLQRVAQKSFQAGRDSMKEESLIEVEFNDGSKKKVEPKEAIEFIKKDIEALRSNFK